jgi:hypothetical protein
MPLAGVPVEARITRSAAVPQACLAIFAVTLTDGMSRSSSVDLAPVANANHAIDFFLPDTRANYFPDLAPGITRSAGYSFAFLAPGPWITAGTTLTTSGDASYAQRMPLHQVPSRDLLLLVDGNALSRNGAPVVRLSVDYTTGASTSASIVAGKHVSNYEHAAAEPVAWRGTVPQDLSLYTLALDRSRIPRAVWIRGATAQGSLAIFAMTQHIAP